MRKYEICKWESNCKLKWFQAKHSVTLGNWITIIFYVKLIDKLMLIIFHYFSYLNLQFTLNMMKSWGNMKFSKWESNCKLKWFQAKHSVTLGNWITIIFYVKLIDKLMLIIFHYFSYLNLQFTLNKMKSWGNMKFVNESQIASWNDFKQNIVLLLEIG